MFSRLIEDGRALVAKLERYRHTDISDIPPAERLASAEINGWFDAAESLVLETFGSESNQFRKWRAVQDELSRTAEEEIMQRRWNEATSAIRRVHSSMGLLTEFRHYAPASEPVESASPRSQRDDSVPDSLQTAFLHVIWPTSRPIRVAIVVVAGLVLGAFGVWTSLPESVKTQFIDWLLQ